MLESSDTPVAETNTDVATCCNNQKKSSKKINIDKKIRDLKIMFLLATAYSSNIGGWWWFDMDRDFKFNSSFHLPHVDVDVLL